MSLRTRFATVVAATVTVALVLGGVMLQAVTSAVLVGAIDTDLRAIAASVERDPRGIIALSGAGRGRFGGAAGLFQIVDDAGTIQQLHGPLARADGAVRLPVDDVTLAVARGSAPATLATVVVEGVPLRLLTVPFSDRFALQVARPIDEVEQVLARLRRATLLVGLLGVGIATLAARRIAGRAIRPVATLTAAVEDVRGGSDLARPLLLDVAATGDEVGRLAQAFEAMLRRLDTALRAQERLSADAAHELRTPLTSLRTNVEVLVAGVERLDPAARTRLAEDVVGQLEELTVMVDGLVSLARVDAAVARRETVDVRALVTDVVDAARRRHPQRATDLVVGDSDGRPAPLTSGDERELALAVSALLDNAVKYAPQGPIVVTVGRVAGEVVVTVRDHGPGVDPDDLPHLFERFFRSQEARSAPGAGLGLALVERVAQAHGGHAEATLVAPNGLQVMLRLPAEAPERPQRV